MALNVADLWAGKAPARVTVEAEAREVNRLWFPVWKKIRWRVPARGAMPPVTFTWHQAPGLAPGSRKLIEGLLRDHGAIDDGVSKHLPYAGAILVGSKGALVTDSHNVTVTLLPKETYAGTDTRQPKTVPASRGHYQDWVRACRCGELAWANFAYAGSLSEFLMLGNVATRFEGSWSTTPPPGRS
jgi:hypothetical protein